MRSTIVVQLTAVVLWNLTTAVSSYLFHQTSPLQIRSYRHTQASLSTKLVSCSAFNSDQNELEDDSAAPVYTQKQILKEETEAPFRPIRIYAYISLLGAAGLSALIGMTKILAYYTGAQADLDINSLYTNLAINLAGIPVLIYLWRRDLSARESKLNRISRGGNLASLKIKISSPEGDEDVVRLSDLRTNRGIEKRVVIVASKKEQLLSSVQSSLPLSSSLYVNDLMIVPVIIDNTSGAMKVSVASLESLTGQQSTDPSKPPANTQHIGIPVGLSSWNDIIRDELSIALKQQPDAVDKGITIVIKKNGKVGTRRFGVPLWESLVGEVESRKELGLDIRNI